MTHPTGVRVIRRESTRDYGPGDDEVELLRSLADDIEAELLDDVRSIVIDWRDDGCYLRVHCDSYVVLHAAGSGT